MSSRDFSVADVASIVGVSFAAAADYIGSGELGSTRIHGRRRVSQDHILAFLSSDHHAEAVQRMEAVIGGSLAPAAMSFRDVLRAFPYLTERGFFDCEFGKPLKSEIRHIRSRPGFQERRAAVHDEAAKIERCAEWLRSHIEPRKARYRFSVPEWHVYSYFGGPISAGAFCAAGLIAGFDIETRGRIHWGTFKWGVESWERAYDAVYSQRIAAKDAGVTRLPGSYQMRQA